MPSQPGGMGEDRGPVGLEMLAEEIGDGCVSCACAQMQKEFWKASDLSGESSPAISAGHCATTTRN